MTDACRLESELIKQMNALRTGKKRFRDAMSVYLFARDWKMMYFESRVCYLKQRASLPKSFAKSLLRTAKLQKG